EAIGDALRDETRPTHLEVGIGPFQAHVSQGVAEAIRIHAPGPTVVESERDAAALLEEKERSLYWYYRFLSASLAPHTQHMLALIASSPNGASPAELAIRIGSLALSPAEIANVVNALLSFGLVTQLSD